MIKRMEEEFKYGLMEVDMKANGNRTKPTDMAGWCMLKVIFLKVSGVMIKQMDREHILK